ncbi:MAG: acyl-CoA dehydrogenase family protein [Nitrospinota bacterium]|nr:acyl-CoA dehydrogenase family protein [Nitrospinota bacterium]
MNPLELSEELILLQNTIKDLTTKHIKPRASEIDEEEKYPEDIYQILKKHDLLGLFVEEEYGGTNLGILGTCVAIEEIAKHCSNSPLFLSIPLLATRPISVAGTLEQKEHFLTGVAKGNIKCSLSMTEPHAGTDVANIKTLAVKDGDSWVINGQKTYCTGSSFADYIILGAKSDPDAGHEGLIFLIVPTNSDGFQIGRHERKMGMRGIPTCELIFENCRIPIDNQIGEERTGFKTAMLGFNQARPVIGARGVGLAQGCLDYAVDYAKEREAFSKPIAKFQGIQLMIAEMFINIEAGRLLVHKAARLIDNGKIGKEYAHYFSAAKSFSSDVAMKTSVDSIQILGGAGYMKDHPLERFMRDAKQLQIIEGTNQIQQILIAKNLLGY